MTKRSFIKEFVSRLSVLSLRFFLAALKVLPRKVLDLLIQGMFPLAYSFMQKLRQICESNMRSVFGDSRTSQEYRSMTKGCIRNISHGMLDMLYYIQRPQELSPIVDFHHEERLQEALRSQCGVIAVTAHMGNFPLMFMALARKGYKVNVIIRPMRDARFSRFIFELCDRQQIHMIPLFPSGRFLKESLGALKRNELLFILLDEFVPEKSGVVVDFFNSRVPRAAGPMLFYRRTGSPIVPMFVIKNNRGRLEVFVEPPLAVEPGGASQENDCRYISILTSVIEDFVRKYPLQWGGWLNKRWAHGSY